LRAARFDRVVFDVRQLAFAFDESSRAVTRAQDDILCEGQHEIILTDLKQKKTIHHSN
jgi:hypothetical protein